VFRVAGATPARLPPRHPRRLATPLSLINDILCLAAIGAGHPAQEAARLDIRDMLDPVPTAAPQKALGNLMWNAIKCTPPRRLDPDPVRAGG
jgi:hypothetical protein